MDETVTRRQTLSALGSGIVLSIAGCVTPTSKTQDVVDLSQLDNILEIETEETHTILSNNTELYDSVLWESGGTLELEVDSAIELTAISN